MFNKKFNDKYPDVRKPIICNGLKAIIPYKKQNTKCIDEESIDEESVEPEIEPEPEPEMIIPDNP